MCWRVGERKVSFYVLVLGRKLSRCFEIEAFFVNECKESILFVYFLSIIFNQCLSCVTAISILDLFLNENNIVSLFWVIVLIYFSLPMYIGNSLTFMFVIKSFKTNAI